MKKAIITGSETFGKYMTSPTKWLALYADGKVIADYEIHSLIFPAVVLLTEGEENPGEIIARKAQEISADVIISFGMALDRLQLISQRRRTTSDRQVKLNIERAEKRVGLFDAEK